MDAVGEHPQPIQEPFAFPWATAAVVFVAVAVFFSQFILGMNIYKWVRGVLTLFPVEWFMTPDGPDFLNSKWVLYFSGLFGYPFNHSGWRHLASNCLTVILCGYFIERRFVRGDLGRGQYLVFVWALGVLAGIATNMWATIHIDIFGREAFGRGMSGIGFGLIGAVLAIGGRIP